MADAWQSCSCCRTQSVIGLCTRAFSTSGWEKSKQLTSIANSPLALCHLLPLESFCLAVFSLPAYPTGTCFAMLTNPGWACSTCKARHVVTTGQERVPRCHLQQVSQELKHSSLRLCSKGMCSANIQSNLIKLDKAESIRKHPKASESIRKRCFSEPTLFVPETREARRFGVLCSISCLGCLSRCRSSGYTQTQHKHNTCAISFHVVNPKLPSSSCEIEQDLILVGSVSIS